MITDTTKNDNREWLFGGNPTAIETQEKEGQNQLKVSQQLPRKISLYRGEPSTNVYKKLGFIEINNDVDDDLFVSLQFPCGWEIISTEHSMWSKLIDNLGRERASIFYKAAFYDRDAHISFNTRYRASRIDDTNAPPRTDTYERIEKTNTYGVVFDQSDIIFETKKDIFDLKHDETNHRKWWNTYDQFQKDKTNECINWLNEKYPKWESIYEYWNK